MAKRGLSVATIAAQAGGYIDAASGGVVPPIQPSTTFARDRSYQPHPTGNIYARDDNDVGRIAEALLAQLDNAEPHSYFPMAWRRLQRCFELCRAGRRSWCSHRSIGAQRSGCGSFVPAGP